MPCRRLVATVLAFFALCCAAGHCGAAPESTYAQAFARAALLRDAGKRIFADPAFSASGRQACASCHAPAARYNPPNALDVQPGGMTLHDFAFRAPPTLTYLNRIPPYDNHFHESDEEGDESIDNGPTGGLTWDGRVDNGANQAQIPLLAEHEMANTRAGVAAAIRKASYAGLLTRALGADALADDGDAFNSVVRALG
ncbi:MAG: cytochrome-c peroxidase, partial [Rudaea sp.]